MVTAHGKKSAAAVPIQQHSLHELLPLWKEAVEVKQAVSGNVSSDHKGSGHPRCYRERNGESNMLPLCCGVRPLCIPIPGAACASGGRVSGPRDDGKGVTGTS